MQVEDEDGDEADGLDEAIFPADVQQEGCLVDDVIHELLVRPLKEGEQAEARLQRAGPRAPQPAIYHGLAGLQRARSCWCLAMAMEESHPWLTP